MPPLCTICLPNAAGQLLHLSERLHPDGYWLVHGETESAPLSCTLERVQPGLSSVGHTRLLTAALPVPQTLGQTPHNPLDFEDTHIQKWISLIGDIENRDVHTYPYPFMPFP